MTGHRPWAELRVEIVADPVRRARIEEGVRAIEDGYALVRLRAELGLPEYEVEDDEDDTNERDGSGDALPADGRGSQEDEVYVATLRDFVEAIGGRLEINAVFPDSMMSLLPGRRWVVAGADNAEQPDPVRDRAVAPVR